MAGVIGLLGTLPFTCSQELVLTFRDLQVDRASRWATHEVIGTKPVLEYLGPQLKTVSFTVPLNSFYCRSALGVLKLIGQMVDGKEPQRLMIGPEYYGKFIVESVSESRTHHTGLGVLVAASITINLKEAQ